MQENFNKLKREIALNPKGRFIPYIGEQYSEGLGCKQKNNPTILIIGPRHYCDASYSSRNLLAHMTRDMRDALSSNPDATFPADLKVGCIEKTAKNCLRDKYNSCPVYLATENKECPLRVNCQIRSYGMDEVGFKCEKSRNLRCETLYAIHEYLNKPSIESARLGLTYFDSITRFLMEEFLVNEERPIKVKNIWKKVAFTNLIQRYIPLKDINFDSKTIGKEITDADIIFCKKMIIEKLKPDYIVMTMSCIEYALKTVISDDYESFKIYKNRGWYIYKLISDNTQPIVSEWEVICNLFFENYTYPASSIEFGEEIYNLIEVLDRDASTSGEPLKSRKRIIRTKILEIIRTKLKKRLPQKPKYAGSIKCLDSNIELNQAEEIMRNWIKNAHERIVKKSNSDSQIKWTSDEIKKWLNAKRQEKPE